MSLLPPHHEANPVPSCFPVDPRLGSGLSVIGCPLHPAQAGLLHPPTPGAPRRAPSRVHPPGSPWHPPTLNLRRQALVPMDAPLSYLHLPAQAPFHPGCTHPIPKTCPLPVARAGQDQLFSRGTRSFPISPTPAPSAPDALLPEGTHLYSARSRRFPFGSPAR